jgi:hypothetical protein
MTQPLQPTSTIKQKTQMKIQSPTKRKTKMKIHSRVAAFSAAILTMAGAGFAAYGQDDDPWRFAATIPLWAPRIDGTATLLGHEKDVNVGFDKLKDHLETALSLNFEARKQEYGFYGGFGYMKFTESDSIGNAELQFLIVEGGGFARLVKTEGDHPFILEGLLGVRYWHTKTTLGIPAIPFNGGKTRELADPIIGLRGSQILCRKCHLDFQGDVGGFDISYKTDFTWSAATVLTYDFAKWFSVSAGYKALSLDVSNGNANASGVNVVMHGPLIAAKFIF